MSKCKFSLCVSLLSLWQNAAAFQAPNATSFAIGFLYFIIPAAEILLLQTRNQDDPRIAMGAWKHSHF